MNADAQLTSCPTLNSVCVVSLAEQATWASEHALGEIFPISLTGVGRPILVLLIGQELLNHT